MRALIAVACFLLAGPLPAQDDETLEIHYINIGQGGGTLIIGPNGTTVMYDFGNVGRGRKIAEYLDDELDISPSRGIDYAIVSHRDADHYGGYVGLIDAGYDINIANFDSGSDKRETEAMRRVWLTPAARTSAGQIIRIPPGLTISLGNGALLHVIAANGRVFGHDSDAVPLPSARNENDRSISLYLKYRNFDYVLDGDLGAGEEECTARQTHQKDFQLPAAKQLAARGMDPELGVDVLHISHHGSESSTSAAYYNDLKPEVGLISVGLNQRSFRHPRVDVVERVLLGSDRAPCVTAPPLKALFQTDWGRAGTTASGSTSFAGMPVGDIRLVTDGKEEFQISGSGLVEDPDLGACVPIGGDAWSFAIDDTPGSDQPSFSQASVNETCMDQPSLCGCTIFFQENSN